MAETIELKNPYTSQQVQLLVQCQAVLQNTHWHPDTRHPDFRNQGPTLLKAFDLTQAVLQFHREHYRGALDTLAIAATMHETTPNELDSRTIVRKYDDTPRSIADRVAICQQAIDWLNIPDSDD